MNSYLLADKFLQHALNAGLSFFLFAFMTWGCIKLFRIKNYRLRASLRLVPFLRLLLEPLFWLLPSSATLVNVSIFSCSHPFQLFLFGSLSEGTRETLSLYNLKTVSGSLLLQLPSFVVSFLMSGVVLVSLLGLFRVGVKWSLSVVRVRKLRRRATPFLPPLRSERLRKQLLKRKTEILLSDEIHTPMATWGNAIVLPKKLAQGLAQEELEAILAHELEHHRWKDGLTRLISHAVSAIYWWIPMKKWKMALQHEQEVAADASVHQDCIDGLHLATALHKTAKTRSLYGCAAFAAPSAGKALRERLRLALYPQKLGRGERTVALLGALILLGLIPIIGFVIC